METKELTTNKFGEAIIHKFVNEEIMTKSELDIKLDAVMQKYTKHIDAKFDIIDKRFEQVDKRFEQVDKRFEQVDRQFMRIDIRYNWIIGIIISSVIALGGLIIKLH